MSIARGNFEDCSEPDLWLDETHLVSRDALDDVVFFCPACDYEYTLWEALLELSVDRESEAQTPEYGRRVFAAISNSFDLKHEYITIDDLTASELEDIRVFDIERNKYEAMRAWEQQQRAAAEHAKIIRHRG